MRLGKNQIIGVALLIALIMIYVPLPLIEGKNIAAIIILACAAYQLIR